MSRLFFCCLFFSVWFSGSAQQEPDLSAFPSLAPDLSGERAAGKQKIPFRSILVRDARFDTTKLGYIYASEYKKISFPVTCSRGLEEMLNNYCYNILDPQSDRSLLIVLKKYWLQSGAAELMEDENTSVSNNGESYRDKTGVCFADADVFTLQGTECRALVRITANFIDKPFKQFRLNRFIFPLFDSLITKIRETDVAKATAGKNVYAFSGVMAQYAKRFDIPVLKNTQPEKGVFSSFKDFQDNKVTYTSFKVKEGKLSDELYIINNGQETILKDYWGFYDGTHYYVRLGFSFFRLYRQNNTWDLYGNRRISFSASETSAAAQGNSFFLKSAGSYLFRRPLQLNMETGNVY